MTDAEKSGSAAPDVQSWTTANVSADTSVHDVSGVLPPSDFSRVLDVKVELSVELGRKRLSIAEVLNLGPNSVLEFLKKADEPLDIRVNGRLVARGEAVVLADRYGVRITELVNPSHSQGRISVEGITG